MYYFDSFSSILEVLTVSNFTFSIKRINEAVKPIPLELNNRLDNKLQEHISADFELFNDILGEEDALASIKKKIERFSKLNETLYQKYNNVTESNSGLFQMRFLVLGLYSLFLLFTIGVHSQYSDRSMHNLLFIANIFIVAIVIMLSLFREKLNNHRSFYYYIIVIMGIIFTSLLFFVPNYLGLIDSLITTDSPTFIDIIGEKFSNNTHCIYPFTLTILFIGFFLFYFKVILIKKYYSFRLFALYLLLVLKFKWEVILIKRVNRISGRKKK